MNPPLLSTRRQRTSGMMRDLLSLCFLATFVATGESLSCEICEGLGDTCVGPLHTCPPGFDTCGIIQVEGTVGFKIRTVVKTCSSTSNCNQGLTIINLGNYGTIVQKQTCCMGSECAKIPPSLPPISTALNGRKCPACYSVHDLTCNEEIAQCAGDELYCFELAGTTNLGGMSMTSITKGCTNIDACNDTLNNSGSFAGINVVTTAKCTLAPVAAGSITGPLGLSFFFQAFSAILLGKILS